MITFLVMSGYKFLLLVALVLCNVRMCNLKASLFVIKRTFLKNILDRPTNDFKGLKSFKMRTLLNKIMIIYPHHKYILGFFFFFN